MNASLLALACCCRLNQVKPKTDVEARVYAALLNAAASEHAFHQRAMKSATDNAEELNKSLSRVMNRARQDSITTEIMEIVGGAEALDSGDDDISDDPLLATYHLAALAPIGPADRYRLLTARGPENRLDVLDEILDDVEAMLKFRLS